jgi:hypothetical protein
MAWWLIRVGNQTRHQIDHESRQTAVTRVLNLADIFQLIIHRLDQTPFDQTPFAQHQPIPQPHQARLHIAPNQRDQF